MTTIPTLKQLYDSILSDLETQFGVSISQTGKVFIRALAMAQAGKLKLYYLFTGKLQKNIFADTADPEALGGTLERFGRVKLGRNPFPPIAAQYSIAVTGDTGAIIPAQTTFRSDISALNPGQIYILDVAHTMAATSDVITVRALTSGLAGKLAIGNKLKATQPISLVDSDALVDSVIVQPLAGESIEEYRAAILAAFQLEPQGGAATDYRLWSYDVQGVKQAYPYAKSNDANVVDVFIEATIIDSIDGKGTPSAGMLTDVRAVIEFDPDTTRPTTERGRRPLGVYAVNCLAITPKNIDITISDLTPLTTDAQTAIAAVIDAEIYKIRPYIAGCDIASDKNDILDQNRLAYMIISAVPGAVFSAVELKVAGVVVSTYTFTQGNIPYYNSLTYV